LALIKGTKYPSPGEEPEEINDPKTREDTGRKGGLIKASRIISGKNDETSPLNPISGQQEPFKRRGRVLKSWETSILRIAETEVKGKKSKTIDPSEDAGETTVLSKKNLPKPESKEETQPSPDDEFTVEEEDEEDEIDDDDDDDEEEDDDDDEEEEETKPDVDVEAIIAAAEEEAQEKANMIIEHAQTEAKRLIEQAKIYGETAKSEAYEEGFKIGKEEGYKAGQEVFSDHMKKAGNLIKHISDERNRVLEEVEPELAKLSLEIAKKIIGDEITTNPDVVISVVKQAMIKMRSRERVTIKVNPDDLKHAKEHRNVFAAMIEGMKEMDIVGDPRVEKGGCLIETNLGNTDARINTQLDAIILAFSNLEKGTYM
jgi:flagellar assembly protein FliH